MAEQIVVRPHHFRGNESTNLRNYDPHLPNIVRSSLGRSEAPRPEGQAEEQDNSHRWRRLPQCAQLSYGRVVSCWDYGVFKLAHFIVVADSVSGRTYWGQDFHDGRPFQNRGNYLHFVSAIRAFRPA